MGGGWHANLPVVARDDDAVTAVSFGNPAYPKRGRSTTQLRREPGTLSPWNVRLCITNGVESPEACPASRRSASPPLREAQRHQLPLEEQERQDGKDATASGWLAGTDSSPKSLAGVPPRRTRAPREGTVLSKRTADRPQGQRTLPMRHFATPPQPSYAAKARYFAL